MKSLSKARSSIVGLWEQWSVGGAGDKGAFYDWLSRSQPHLLAFPCKAGRSRDIVELWLFNR